MFSPSFKDLVRAFQKLKLFSRAEEVATCSLTSGSGASSLLRSGDPDLISSCAARWKKVALLGTGETASATYFVLPLLRAHSCNVAWFSIEHAPEGGQEKLADCDAVIVVRYISRAWGSVLREFKRNGGEIVYFMDDDLMDPGSLRELPRDYANRIRRAALGRQKDIESLTDYYWVSTYYLANKYAKWEPSVVPLGTTFEEIPKDENVTVCYHGTASHSQEIDWLRDIVVEVQKHTHNVHFEFFGDLTVNRKYREVPRVSVLHPMSWNNYLSYTSKTRHQIALAPLLTSPFNAGRGATKFLDFTRMSAVGIFTDIEPYRGFVHHEIDGLLIPNDKEIWVQAIISLAHGTERRSVMAKNARERVAEISKQLY